MKELHLLLATLVASILICCPALAATDPADTYPDLHLIPWPKSLQKGTGHMQLTTESRIVAGNEQLRPLAEVLVG